MKTTEQIMNLHDIAATELVHGHYHPLKEKRAALRKAIEELHRDAARYLWLRENYNSQVLVCRDKLDARDEWPEYSHEALDAVIDAAMQVAT